MENKSAYMLKYNYGLTPEQYLAMLENQGYTCAICKSSKWGNKTNTPNVDHDHVTGKVRGLLCKDCNLGLGRFKDSRYNLTKAIDYLSKHKYDTIFY